MQKGRKILVGKNYALRITHYALFITFAHVEQKKSIWADVERTRTTGFLLGLIVALAIGFAALEFSVSSSDDELDLETLEEVVEEMNLDTPDEMKDMVPAELPQEAVEQKVAEKVREVAEPESSQQETNAPVAQALIPDKPKIQPVEVPERMQMDLAKVPPVILDINDNPANLRVVEDTPKPVGGWVAFMKWLTKNLRYPYTAKAQKIQGTVLLTFIVDEDGNVGDIQIKKSLEPSLDREAQRVAKMIRKWEPAMKDGKPVKAMVGIPVVFKL